MGPSLHTTKVLRTQAEVATDRVGDAALLPLNAPFFSASGQYLGFMCDSFFFFFFLRILPEMPLEVLCITFLPFE